MSTNWPTVLANLLHPQTTTSQPMKKKEKSYQSSVTMRGIKANKHAPSKEGVKREARHEHAVDELDDTSQDEKDEESIDEF